MKKIVFLTGAGISAESGITTFRDSGGLWEQYRVEDVASIDGYYRNPQLVTNFYNERRNQLMEVEPNEAHRLVAKLEEKYDVCVVTQNVDDLHERAGSTNIIHLHGELRKSTSSRNPNDPTQIMTLPEGRGITYPDDRAPDGSPARPFIVWFGEAVPMIEPAAEQVGTADILVVVGTSLNVYPAAGLINYARSDAQIYLIDPSPANVPQYMNIHIIAKKATEGMRELYEELVKS
ncbi:MAG: NAD-dependent deacylase [Bacteroidaceae bacterium]|nr:NAD-dependent deacylase [Bacteroidaceae bacterium]MBR1379910.1 NAD-dependent deacylase [Bacteroidaceae bacterium]